MKLTTTSGKIVDTTKLPTEHADVYEALNNLFKVCKKHKLLVFSRVVLNKTKYVGAQTINKDSNTQEFMLELINDYVDRTTDGKLGIALK